VDIGQGLAARGRVDDFFVIVGECVVEQNNGASADFHRKEKVFTAEDSALETIEHSDRSF
jgi:hypothetical protein